MLWKRPVRIPCDFPDSCLPLALLGALTAEVKLRKAACIAEASGGAGCTGIGGNYLISSNSPWAGDVSPRIGMKGSLLLVEFLASIEPKTLFRSNERCLSYQFLWVLITTRVWFRFVF